MDKNYFSSRSPLKVNMLFASAFCVILLCIDTAFPNAFNPIKHVAKYSFDPLYIVSGLSTRASEVISTHTRSKLELLQEIDDLKKQRLDTQARQQLQTQITLENQQLRHWLELPSRSTAKLSLIQVIGHEADMTSHVLVISQGSRQGVHVGQFAIDSQGLMGQIIEVYPFSARLMLLSDKHHSVSVRNQRTGGLAILSGTGDATHLTLDYVPATTDIRVGDVLVTSGMGSRFNAGYPAGIVEDIKKHGKREFAEITVKPIAGLQRSIWIALLDFIAPPAPVAPAVPDSITQQAGLDPATMQPIVVTPPAAINLPASTSATTIETPAGAQPNTQPTPPANAADNNPTDNTIDSTADDNGNDE